MTPIYTAEITSVGGRNGHVESSDGALNLDLTLPKPGGDKAKRSNPEQLFAAGYAACFAGAMEHVGRATKQDPGQISILAKASLGKDDADAFRVDVDFDITAPNLTQAEAEKLVEEAHKVCPYSNATRGNIDVKLTAHGGKS
jgi:osmotically inducible protein OsmC